MTELETLTQAIAALEAQRPILGDAMVDTMLVPAREKLAMLQAQAASAVEQQRKQVTVLFADVSGFTAMSETLDAEEVTEIMNALWARLDEAITAHGGKIDKHIGDAVMALWGVESAREDDPERAIRAALAMQAEIASLQMRIGLNTGPVLLGGIGSTHEFTAMGDTVNVALRLEHAAPVGGILISHDTYRQVRGVFDVQVQAPLSVKGKAAPLQTYVVLQAKPRAFRMGTRGVEGIETHMVGRDAELLTLQNAFADALGSETRLALVVGEAGVGKSRLLYEFEHWIDLRPETIYFFKGRSAPALQNVPYGLWRDLFAYRFEILESDSPSAALEKFRAGMVEVLPAERADLVGQWIGFDFSLSLAVKNLLGSAEFGLLAQADLIQYFRSMAANQPVVLFLEDLHWADDSSLNLVERLLDALPEARLLIAGLTRPNLFERRAHWVEGMPALERLELKPLSRRASRELVEEILQKMDVVPEALRELVVEGAEGNPFYLEELVKMLIDEGVIERQGEIWSVNLERLKQTHVPPTLTGILQARLDGLPREEREVLQRAAVVGRLFWDAAVADLSGVERAEVGDMLSALRGRELVYWRERSAFAGTEEFLFKHALLRDAAYETVLLRLRKEYHARVAGWLEAASGARRSEYLPQIAEHYEKAGNAAQATLCYEQAGDQAMRISAFADAVRFYTRAQDLPGLSNLTDFYLKLAEAHFRLGEFSTARLALEQAQATAQNDAERASALALLGEIASGTGNYGEAQQALATAIPLARASGNQMTLCRALYALGDVDWRVGKLDEAHTVLEESLTLARALGDVTRELFALNRLGTVTAFKGDSHGAEQLYQEVHTRALAVGNRERAMTGLANLGVVAHERKDFLLAVNYMQQALALTREIGVQSGEALHLRNLAGLHIELGDLPAARARLREGLALALRLSPLLQVGMVTCFADLAHAEGQIERALALFGLARHQPAWSSDDQRDLEYTLTEWALDPAVVEAGLKKGEALDWEQTIQELLRT